MNKDIKVILTITGRLDATPFSRFCAGSILTPSKVVAYITPVVNGL